MSNVEKKKQMMNFWTDRILKFAGDPRANTNDVWLREVEIDAVARIISANGVTRVLDFGCANGYTTIRIAKQHPECEFCGVDINGAMISVAKNLGREERCANVSFAQADLLAGVPAGQFDLVYAIRVFQNMESFDVQRSVFDKLHGMISVGGMFYFIESYADGYAVLNEDRQRMGLPPLPIHPHLTLLTEEFDKHVAARMQVLERGSPSSAYYLITRLLYSYIAMQNKEPIDYNHPIHQVAAMVPQIGSYGPQKSGLYRKA